MVLLTDRSVNNDNAWGFYADRLFKLQQRAKRIFTNSKHNVHTEPLFKKLNLWQLRDLSTHYIVKLFYEVKTKTLPEYFQELFSATNPTPYELRATPLFQETVVRSGSGKKCTRYHLPNIIKQNGFLYVGIMQKALLQKFHWCHEDVFD